MYAKGIFPKSGFSEEHRMRKLSTTQCGMKSVLSKHRQQSIATAELSQPRKSVDIQEVNYFLAYRSDV